VFSHVGSGYFLGVPTYLSKYFILNPILFRKEHAKLKIPKDYKIYISHDSLVTTYWDMLANRAMEEMLGGNAHGSCGAGINTTIQRSKEIPFHTPLILSNSTKVRLYDTLAKIKEYWLEQLLEFSVKIHKSFPEWVLECFNRYYLINEQFVEDLFFMRKVTDFMFFPATSLFNKVNYAIFEGAQGLALDQFYGNFPYVTRSNTSIRNVLEMQRECQGEFSIDEIVYVSRTYETRHGYDPTFIGGELTFPNASDKTNVKNEWQGELRYRKLSYAHLADRIKLDLQANNLWGRQEETGTKVRLALTHLDQVSGMDITDYEEFYRRTNLSVPVGYESGGETREDVVERL